MARGRLAEFFRQKRAHLDATTVDWEKKRADWLKAVDGLYRTVEKHLAGPIAEGTVSVTRERQRISEDYIGEYDVPVLVLDVGDEKVRFRPKGALVIGAAGRVDLQGDMGQVTIVRQPRDRWAIVAARTPSLKLLPLSEESLLDALKSVMRQ